MYSPRAAAKPAFSGVERLPPPHGVHADFLPQGGGEFLNQRLHGLQAAGLGIVHHDQQLKGIVVLGGQAEQTQRSTVTRLPTVRITMLRKGASPWGAGAEGAAASSARYVRQRRRTWLWLSTRP